MPTIVSYLGNNAFGPKDNGELGEGMVYNTLTSVREEQDVTENELLKGYRVGDSEALGVTEAQHAVKLGRTMDGHTTRELGALTQAN